MTDSGQHKTALNRLNDKVSDGQDAFEAKSSDFELSLNFDIDDLLENDLPKYDSNEASKSAAPLKHENISAANHPKLPDKPKVPEKHNSLKFNFDDSSLPLAKGSSHLPLLKEHSGSAQDKAKSNLPLLKEHNGSAQDKAKSNLPLPKSNNSFALDKGKSNLPLPKAAPKSLATSNIDPVDQAPDSDSILLPKPKLPPKTPSSLPNERRRVETDIATRSKATPAPQDKAIKLGVPNFGPPPLQPKTGNEPASRSRIPTIGIGNYSDIDGYDLGLAAPTPMPSGTHKPTIDFGSERFMAGEEGAHATPMIHKAPEAKASIDAHKIDLADVKMQPPLLLREDGRVSDSLFIEHSKINDDSGLPLSDDPLSILPPSTKRGPESRERKPSQPPAINPELFGQDFLSLFPSTVPNAKSKPGQTPPPPLRTKTSEKLLESKLDMDFLGLFGHDTALPGTLVSEQAKLSQASYQAPHQAPRQAPFTPPPKALAATPADVQTEMVFEMASLQSSGVPSPVVEARNATPKAQVSKSKKRGPWLAIVAVLAVVGAVLLIAYKYYDQIEAPSSNVAAVEPTKAPSLDWESIKYDTPQAYKAFYDQSRERLLDSTLSQDERAEIQGKILIALSLAQTRYGAAFEASQAAVDSSIASISESCQNPWCYLGLWAWAGMHQKTEDQGALAPKLSQLAEFAELKALIEAAQIYAQWQPKQHTRSEAKATALKIQGLLKKADQHYPLGTLIQAQSHFLVGEFSQAKTILSPLLDETKAPYLAAMSLDARLSYQLGDFESAQKKAQSLLLRADLDAQERTASLLIDANVRVNAADWNGNSDYLMDLAKQHPQDEALNSQISQICHIYHKTADCQQGYQSLLEANPENAVYRRALCRSISSAAGVNQSVIDNTVLDERNAQVLLTCVEEGLVKSPQDKTLWLLQITAYYAMKRFEEAIDTSLEFERIPELAYIAALTKTITLLSSSDLAKAKEAKQSFDKRAKEVYALDEGLSMATILVQMRDFEGAHLLLDWLRILAPQDLRITVLDLRLNIASRDLEKAKASVKILGKRSALSLDDRFEIAKLNEELGDANEALLAMSVLVVQAPDNPQYLETIALLYYNKGVYDAAKQYLDKTLLLEATNHKAHYYKGLCYYKEQDYQNALVELQAAISFDIDNPSYNFWVAQSLSKLGEIEDAYRIFSRIIDTDNMAAPDAKKRISPRDLSQTYYFRALLSKDNKHKRDAAKDFKQAIALDSKDPQYHQSYAIFLYEGGKCADALTHMSEVEAINGAQADAVVYFIKGQCALKSRDRALAMKSFEIAIEKGFADNAEIGIDGYRDPAQIYEQVGYLYRDAGRKNEARKALEQYLEKSKRMSNSDRRTITREIDKL